MTIGNQGFVQESQGFRPIRSRRAAIRRRSYRAGPCYAMTDPQEYSLRHRGVFSTNDFFPFTARVETARPGDVRLAGQALGYGDKWEQPQYGTAEALRQALVDYFSPPRNMFAREQNHRRRKHESPDLDSDTFWILLLTVTITAGADNSTHFRSRNRDKVSAIAALATGGSARWCSRRG